MSLRLVLSISFLSLVLGSLLVSGGVSVVISSRTQRAAVFSEQELAGRNAAYRVRDYVQEKLVALETSARLLVPSAGAVEIGRIINPLMGSYPSIRQLVVLDSEGRPKGGVSRLSRAASRPMYERTGDEVAGVVAPGRRYISPVYMDPGTAEPLVIVAVSVRDVFGDHQGLLVAELNLKFMWEHVASIRIGETGSAYVVDRSGRLIAFGDSSRVLSGTTTAHLAPVAAFVADPGAHQVHAMAFDGIDGVPVVGTLVPLNEPDWAIVTELPVREAYALVRRTILAMAVLTTVMAGLAAIAGVHLARRFSVPLVHLMDVAARIASGERDLQAGPDGPLEIANLAGTFNSMTMQLRALIERLERQTLRLQGDVQRYVEHMDAVGRGNLASRLEIPHSGLEEDEPLLTLARQLNETTALLEKHEGSLRGYSERLERSNGELESFAYVASHDLQEPLRKIRFYADRLLSHATGSLDEKGAEYINRMRNAVDRMGCFIEDLLRYSRVTAGDQPFAQVDLNEILRDVLSDLEVRISETSTRIRRDTLPAIEAERHQMRQLFLNVIGNAMKYHRAGVPPEITIRARAERDGYGIDIADNGIGFDAGDAQRIFGLFQRLHGKSEYEGTGIGLAICKKIAERHGGEIRAQGVAGEGATFRIWLPARQTQTPVST